MSDSERGCVNEHLTLDESAGRKRAQTLPKITHLATCYCGPLLLLSTVLSMLVILLWKVLQTWCVEQLPTPRSFGRPDSYDTPKHDHNNSKNRPKNPEEQTGKDTAKLHGAQSHHPKRKSKPPPAHVEGERTRFVDRCKCKTEPGQTECPHDKRNERPDYEEDVTCHGYISKKASLREDMACNASKVGDCIASHSEGTEWQKRGYNDLAWRQFVKRKTCVVYHQHCHRKRRTKTPHDVRCNQCTKSVVRILEVLSDASSCSCSND